MTDHTSERDGDEPRADVRVQLVNPESGYESATTGKVTPAEWHVIDRIMCGADQVYIAAPELLEALRPLVEQHDKFRQRHGNQEDAYNLIASRWDLFDAARAAIARALSPRKGGSDE